MNINTKAKIAKLRAGQTIYHVNPYGTLDPKDLRIEKLHITHNVRDCGDYSNWNAIYTTTQSLVYDVGTIRKEAQFSDDLCMTGKYTTTSRRNAEAFVKRLQSSGYQDDVLLRHNQRMEEEEEEEDYFDPWQDDYNYEDM